MACTEVDNILGIVHKIWRAGKKNIRLLLFAKG